MEADDANADGSTLIARFGFVSDGVIEGYVVELTAPQTPRFVDIHVNGHYFGTQLACEPIDLRRLHGLGSARHEALKQAMAPSIQVAAGLSFPIPAYVRASRAHVFELFDHHTKASLFREQRNLRQQFEVEVPSRLAGVVLGHMSVTAVDGRRVSFGGPFMVDGDPGDVVVEGRSVTDLQFDLQTDTPRIAPYIDLPRFRGFTVTGSATIGEDGGALRLVDRKGVLTIGAATGLALSATFPQDLRDWAYPPAAGMQRTMGWADNLGYYAEGYQSAVALNGALREFADTDLRSRRAILDWGCGCGRVTQHLLALTDAAVHGSDIDPANLAWCRENLPRGAFVQAGLAPPLDLPDGSMDLVVGVSVFTHLGEEAQHAWLAEIRRLLEPGGLAALTIMSDRALFNPWTTPAVYAQYVDHGISDLTVGNTLQDVLSDADHGYYRETYHSHDYILRNWAVGFDVLGIKRGGQGNFQDIVVLRKQTHSVIPKITF